MCFFKDASIWNLDPHSAHLNNDEDEDEDEEEDEGVEGVTIWYWLFGLFGIG